MQHTKWQQSNLLIPPKLGERLAVIAHKDTANGIHRERMNFSETIVPILIDYIKTNRLVTGDKLPTEVELSAALGVSTRSVREALMTLKIMGVVEARQGVGWHIGKFDLAANVQIVLGPLLQYFNQANIREVFEIRLCIEPFIAEFAARNNNPEELVLLADALEDMKKNIDVNPNEFKAADGKFHNIMVEMCDNRILSVYYSILSGLFLSMVIRLPCKDDYRVFLEHEEIYKKLAAGDAAGTALVARSHVEEAIRYLQKCGLW
jgi:GntR family transcriptional regulator, transcriptional repressor for pyruvate dehydrogenase complex